MFKPKTVASVLAGFQKVIDDLQAIEVAQTLIADKLADQLHEADSERLLAKNTLVNFKKLMGG